MTSCEIPIAGAPQRDSPRSIWAFSVRVLLIGVAVGLSYACMAVPKSAFQPRRLRFLPEIADFGDVGQNQTLTKKVRLVNSLRSPVEVGNINRSCSCLRAAISTKVIPPLSEAEVTVVWETREHEFETKDKLVVFYKTQELSGLQALELDILANVKPGYTLRPAQLSFSARSGPKTARVELKNYSDGATIHHVSTDHDCLKSTLAADRKSFDLDFLPRDFADDSFVVSVQVRTDSTEMPLKTIAVQIVK